MYKRQALHHNGTEIFSYETDWHTWHPPIVGDINGDDSLDIIFNSDNDIYAIDVDGNLLLGFPKYVKIIFYSSPSVDDIDNDGDVELISSSTNLPNPSNEWGVGVIYVWDLNEVYNLSTMGWPMFQHDTLHTGCYEFNLPPVANFTYSVDNRTVFFNASLSYDLDGSIVSWLWEFGDGNISTLQNPSHQYADDGTYNVTLVVTDDDGATDSITKQINVTAGTQVFTFHLSKGWNFVTIPVDAGFSAKTLGQNITGCTIISKWNNSKGMFESYLPGISPEEYNFAIENGVGYFVYVNDNVTVNITGLPITSVAVPLYAGWNTIGWFSAIPTTAKSIGENISNCTTISRWNNSKGMYESYLPGISPEEYNFAVKSGEGLFVYVTKESIWTGI